MAFKMNFSGFGEGTGKNHPNKLSEFIGADPSDVADSAKKRGKHIKDQVTNVGKAFAGAGKKIANLGKNKKKEPAKKEPAWWTKGKSKAGSTDVNKRLSSSPLNVEDGTTVSKDGKKVTKRRTLSKKETEARNMLNVMGLDKGHRDHTVVSGSNVKYTTKDMKPLKNETPEQLKARKKMISKNFSRQQLKSDGPVDVDQLKKFEKATKTAHAVQHFAKKRKKK